MKKIIFVLLVLSIIGCASSARRDELSGLDSLPAYSGPKARIVVADFEVKAAKASAEIGSGLKEMLLSSLVNSSRFSVVERQTLNAIRQEQGIVLTEGQDAEGGPERSKIKAADLIITGAVTEFEPQVSGGRAGIGGGGGAGSGTLGGLLGASINKAHIALDIRIVDATTSEILAATRVQGQASEVTGDFKSDFFGGFAFGGGLSAYANTPMEKAVRLCIVEALRYISQNVPKEYYKY